MDMDAFFLSGKEKETKTKLCAFIKKAEILSILANFNKVLVSNEIAVKAGDFCRISNVETADAIIAATAFAMKAKLVTRNASDFKNIKEITLKVPY